MRLQGTSLYFLAFQDVDLMMRSTTTRTEKCHVSDIQPDNDDKERTNSLLVNWTQHNLRNRLQQGRRKAQIAQVDSERTIDSSKDGASCSISGPAQETAQGKQGRTG